MNTELIQREFESYRKDDEEARKILDAAAERGEDPTPEEEERFDKLFASARAHKARSDKLVAMDADRASLEEAVRHQVGDQADADSGATSDSGSFNSRLIHNIRETVRQYEATQSDKIEFALYGMVDLEKRAIADFSNSGSLYSTEFSTNIAIFQRTVSPWINLASIINADNGRPLNIPNLSVDPTQYSPGEGTAITESTPTLGSAALTTTAYKALSYVSQEAEEDELIGLLPILAKVQGRSIGLAFGSAVTAALLTAMTNGGTAGGTGGVGTAASPFFGYEDLIDLKFSMAVPYRQVGVWIMSNSAIKKVRKFKDQNGAYFYTAASNPQTADTFDGDAIYEDPYLAAAASASKSVVFGDPSAVIIKQMALRVATSSEFLFNLDQVALKTVYRAGAALPDVAALRYLVSANS